MALLQLRSGVAPSLLIAEAPIPLEFLAGIAGMVV